MNADYTLLWCMSGARTSKSWCQPTEDHNTSDLPSRVFLYKSQPSCGIYQYCNMEISSNIYSSFQVSRSFKKASLSNNGHSKRTTITAVPLTRKKLRPWRVWRVHSVASVFVWGSTSISMSHIIPEMWLTVSTVQQQYTTPNTELFCVHKTRPLFGMMLIKNSTIKYQIIEG